MFRKKFLIAFTMFFVIASALVSGCNCNGCKKPDNNDTGDHVHTWSEYTITKHETCTEDGSKYRICTECNETETETISAHHTLGELINESQPTCISTGIKAHKDCSVCGKHFDINGNEISDNDLILPITDHNFAISIIQEQSCTTIGLENKKCTICGYEDTISHDALGHAWDQELTCEHGHTCTRCNASESAINHRYIDTNVAPTCTEKGYILQTCSICGDTHISNYTDEPLGHNVTDNDFTYTKIINENPSVNGYCYINRGIAHCDVCDEDIVRDVTVSTHNFKKTIQLEATCQTNGVYKYICEDCGTFYTEEFSDENAHKWNEGTLNGSVTTYACTHDGCHETKTVVVAQNDAVISSEIWEDISAVELEKASFSLDDNTISQMKENGEVNISVESYNTEDNFGIELSEEQKNTIGNNEIYDFGITSGENAITEFSGSITVRIPYELKENEDPDSIIIFWIGTDELGNPTLIHQQTRYENGFAVFETTHFSYYTVTRLTATQRCELYGHIEVETTVAPTCVSKGYTTVVCTRCGHIEKTFTPALGHDMQIDATKSTKPDCTHKGKTVYACSHEGCGYTYEVINPALGHNWKETEKVDSSCTKTGYIIHTCTECNESYKEIIALKPHNDTKIVVAPTCTEEGYTTHHCSSCGLAYTSDRTEALGHNFEITTVDFSCTEDGYTLHSCTRCDYNFKTDIVSAHHIFDIDEPTCGQGQVCILCGEHGLPATENHKMENGICSVCGQGCEHEFEEIVVAPTCTENGYTLKTCTKCHTEIKTNVVKATGHDGNFVCNICGKTLLPENFAFNAMNCLENFNFTIHTENLDITKFFINPNNDNSNDYSIVINDLDITLKITENGLSGYGELSGAFAYKKIDTPIDGKIYVENNNAYVKFNTESMFIDSETKYMNHQEVNIYKTAPMSGYSIIDIDYILFEQNIFRFDEKYIDIIKQAIKVIPEIKSKIPSFVEKLYNTYPEFDKYFYQALDRVFTIERVGENYQFTLDFDKLSTLNNDFNTKTINEILIETFGENAPSDLKSFVKHIVNEVTIEDAIKFFDDNDIDFESVIKGFNNLANNKFDNYVEMILEYVETEENKVKTISDFFEVTDEMIDDVLALVPYTSIESTMSLDENTIYDTVNDGIEFIKDSTFTIIHNSNGVINTFALTVKDFGTVKILNGEYIKDTYSYLKTKVKSIVDKNAVIYYIKQTYDNVNIDDEGNIFYTEDDFYSSRYYNSESIYQYLKKIYKTTNEDLENLPFVFAYSSCDNIFRYDIAIRETIIDQEYYYTSDGITISLTEDEINNIGFTEKNYVGNSDSLEEIFGYNTKTKEIYTHGSINDFHNWVINEDACITPEKCEDIGETHYYCTICGQECIEYYITGHKHIEHEFEFLTEDHNCDAGVKDITKCTECNKIIDEETYYYHHEIREEVILDGDICEDHILFHSYCPCGYYDGYYAGYYEYGFRANSYENGTFVDDDENVINKEYYYCDKCGLTVYKTTESEHIGCHYTSTSVYEIGLTNKSEDEEDILVTGNSTNEITEDDIIIGSNITAKVNITNKEYSYIAFQVTKSGLYIIESSSDRDTYGILYLNGKELTQNDDGGINQNFLIRYNLTAGQTYVLKTKFYGGGNGSFDITITRGIQLTGKLDTELKVITSTRDYYSHSFIEFAELAEGSETCEDGVIITKTCTNCGHQIERIYNYHYYVSSELICNLSKYQTNGIIYRYSGRHCACEKNTSSNSYYSVELTGNYETSYRNNTTYYTYRDSGLVVAIYRETEPKDENCIAKTYYIIKIGYNIENDTAIETIKVFYCQSENHNSIWTYALKEGSKTCEDGTIVTVKCSDCGKIINTYESHYHETNLIERIDMSDYGCECGGYIDIYACPCGYSGSINTWYHNCDVTDNYEYSGYFNNTNIWEYFTVYHCTVTDPLCNCCYAINAYCEQISDCIIYKHYDLLLGYDTETHQAQRTIRYSTEIYEVHTYGDYVTNEVLVDSENCIYRITETRTCEICGHIEQFSYTSIHHDYQLVDETCCLYECTVCKGTETRHSHGYRTIKEPTCTQDGIEEEYCTHCGEVFYTRKTEPHGHYANYNYQTGLYECEYCHLQGTNYLNGQFILEDCTENEDDDIKVVGYYYGNNDYKFEVKISIVLHDDIETENKNIVIDGVNISYTDYSEGRYAKFSKTEVVNAVLELYEYTEDQYDIRLSFVPSDGGTLNDYAITFGNLVTNSEA